MRDNVIPMIPKQNLFKEDYTYCNIEEEDSIQDSQDDIYEIYQNSKVDVKEIIVVGNVANNTYITGRVGHLKLVTFENIEEVVAYEKQECQNNNNGQSWRTCKDKFKKFPCKIACRFIKQGDFEGYAATYMTMTEYRNELLKSLEQADEAM